MKVLVAGDYCPQYRVAKLFDNDDFATVLGGVKPIIEDADYSIVNFECSVTRGDEKPIEKCGPNLQCTRKGVEAVKWAGFDCVSLANNHFYDFGDDGVDNTLTACKEYGIDTVGGGKNLHEASKVLYKEVNGQTLAVINCCEHEFSIATDKTGGSNPLNPIQQYYAIKEARKHADFVLVIVHGGHEHYQLPSPRMQETYRFFIDVGADAVVNHHQHSYSGFEIYNGKLIFYGLGNFCFDNPYFRSTTWNEGYLITINFNKSLHFQLFPYCQCSETADIRFLENSEIENQLKRLNKCISSHEVLINEYKEFLLGSSKLYESFFTPYSGRIMKGLFKRGLLPSFLSKKKKLALYNFIACESHVIRVLHLLKS